MAVFEDAKVRPNELTPVSDTDLAPEHRAWMNEQIEAALERKRKGEATYLTLEETRRKFGF